MPKLSQLKSEKIRCTIPLFFQDEHLDTIEIYNPDIEYTQYLTECVRESAIDDALKLDMINKLTNIDIDCEIDSSFIEFYNGTFASVVVELDSILLEIATNIALEMYSINKLPEDKQKIISDMIDSQESLMSKAYAKQQERDLENKISEVKAELQLKQEELTFLKGE